MTLGQAIQAYSVAGLDASAFMAEEEAFETCLSFLEGVEKTKAQNKRHDSYGYKHIIENPAGRFGIPRWPRCYSTYIPEGIFILAALASGFTMNQPGRLPTATFNISERSLRERAKDFAKQYAKPECTSTKSDSGMTSGDSI
ncbi:MAG: hypothetical protein WA183_12255 [Chthoniobacterales bacterium]